MKKLYHLYNDKFEITHAQFFTEGEEPFNAIFIENCNFIKPMVNPSTLEVYEGGTSQEIFADKIRAEKQKYIKRTKDGQDAYAEISAEFRIAKLTGQITEAAHAAIEEILIPVRNEVLAGQWISGQNKLVGIGAEAIGQQLYDRLYNQIDAYIQSSYTVEEINAEKVSPTKSK